MPHLEKDPRCTCQPYRFVRTQLNCLNNLRSRLLRPNRQEAMRVVHPNLGVVREFLNCLLKKIVGLLAPFFS
jgi:hypothetical protein